MAATNITAFPARDAQGRFQTGNIGGPGRPRGSRNRLAEQFISDLQADWERHGADVLARVRRHDPSGYLRAVALVCRPAMEVVDCNNCESFADMNGEQLFALLREELGALGFDLSTRS